LIKMTGLDQPVVDAVGIAGAIKAMTSGGGSRSPVAQK
jgi:hypothetical protein